MIREDFKTEIVCILNDKIVDAKDDSDLLDNLYEVIAEEICKYIDEEKK